MRPQRWAARALWGLAWALALVAVLGTSMVLHAATGDWLVAAGVAGLALGVVGLEASAAAGWMPGRSSPALAWGVIAAVAAAAAWAGWDATGTTGGMLVSAMFPALGFSPLALSAHNADDLRT